MTATHDPEGAARPGDWWWRRLPRSVARLSTMAAAVVLDSAYLSAWPPMVALVPIICAAIGVALAAAHTPPGWPFAGSTVVMLAMAATGAICALAGSAFWIGYAATDWLFSPHGVFWLAAHPDAPWIERLIRVELPLLQSCVVLAAGCFGVPMAAGQLRIALYRKRRTSPGGLARPALTQGAIHAGIFMLWQPLAPLATRPVFTWQEVAPPPTSTPPFTWMVAVALLAGSLAALRVVIEARLLEREDYRIHVQQLIRDIEEIGRGPRVLPPDGVLALRVLYGTWLLTGLFATWAEAGLSLVVTALVVFFKAPMAATGKRLLPVRWGYRVALAVVVSVALTSVLSTPPPGSRLEALRSESPCQTALALPGCRFAAPLRPFVVASAISMLLFGLLVPLAPSPATSVAPAPAADR